MKKILFITFYFGDLPWYFNYFFRSCLDNKDIDFIFFGDKINLLPNSRNIKKVNFSIQDFNFLASKTLGFDINITNGYKICDFRPAFGDIFQQYINGYDYWAICDMDIVLGNIRDFLTDQLLDEYDFISVKPEYPTGYMSVFKNTDIINSLYKKSLNYKFIFQEQKNYMFDECAGSYNEVTFGLNILETKSKTDSLHHLLELNKHSIKFLFEYFSIDGIPGDIKYNNGILTYKNKYEILVYHLSDYKKNFLSEKNLIKSYPDKFFISKYSIVTNIIEARIKKINDFFKLYKFKLYKSIDKILLYIYPKTIVNLNEGTYNYMNQKIEITKNSGNTICIIQNAKNHVYKSYIFPDFVYIKTTDKYAKVGRDFIEIYNNNGTPFMYKINI